MIITEEQFLGWLSLPETECILREFPAAMIRQHQEAWSKGNFTSGNMQADMVKNAEMIAECTVWNQVQDLSYRDVLCVLAEELVPVYDEEKQEKERDKDE